MEELEEWIIMFCQNKTNKKQCYKIIGNIFAVVDDCEVNDYNYDAKIFIVSKNSPVCTVFLVQNILEDSINFLENSWDAHKLTRLCSKIISTLKDKSGNFKLQLINNETFKVIAM